MSAQFGKCNFDGKPVDPHELDRVRPVLARYGPDAEGIFRKGNVGIIYREFHTTKGSRLEKQPYVSQSGAVITWDGRLDNRDDLIREFGSAFSNDSTDVLIVAMAYDRWGTDAFREADRGLGALGLESQCSQSLRFGERYPWRSPSLLLVSTKTKSVGAPFSIRWFCFHGARSRSKRNTLRVGCRSSRQPS